MTDEFQDPEERIEVALVAATTFLRRRFAEVLAQLSRELQALDFAEAVAAGNLDQILEIGQRAAERYAASVNERFILMGNQTAQFLATELRVVVSFDQVNTRAVAAMQRNQLRIVQALTNQQRRAVQLALSDAIEQGMNPRRAAIHIRRSIGLTPNQVRAVKNYRRLLQQGSAEALRRQLRDRRFDSLVEAAVSGDRPLTAAQIDRMVRQYQSAALTHRAETIARTEALRSVHEGAEEAYRQAVSQGILAEDDLVREWRTAGDERVRGSHVVMHGQQQPFGQPFITGDGNALDYPGDISAPVHEVINCRCVLTTRFREDAN